MSRATLVGTVRSFPRTSEATSGLDWKLADWLEIRADLMPEPDPIASSFDRRLLYSLRSRRAGGRDDSPIRTRQRRLRGAALVYDLVDLEGDRDLAPETLARISPERRVISWYGEVRDEQTLHQLLQKFSRTEALLYRFEIACSRVEEAIITLQFLNRAKRPDVIAYAPSPVGVWTRILAPQFGAPFVFGTLGEDSEDGAAAILRRRTGERILSEMRPFDEKLAHAPSKRRPKIVDAIWTLYPSPEFVDEVIGHRRKQDGESARPGRGK